MPFTNYPVRDSKGRFAKQKVINKRSNSLAARNLARREKSEPSKQTYRPNLCPGRRIVELNELGKNLKCCECKNVLSLEKITKETRLGLNSISDIVCDECAVITQVLYSGVGDDFHGAMERLESNDVQIFREIQAGIKAERSTESLRVKKETEQIIEEYDAIGLDSDSHIEQDFHAVMESTKYEETEIKTEEMEFGNIDLPISYEIHEISRSDQSLQDEKAPPVLCRLCAIPCTDTIYIFGLYNIIEKIQHCLPITVEKTDALSKRVCQSCLEKLELCHQFHEAVKQAEEVQLLAFHGQTSTVIHRQTSSQRNEQSMVVKNDNNRANLNTVSDEDASNIEAEGLTNLGEDNETESPKGKADLGKELKFDERVSDLVDHSTPSIGRQSESQIGIHLIPNTKSSYPLRKKVSRIYYSSDEDILSCDKEMKSCAPAGQIMECQIRKTTFQTNKECQSHARVHAWTNQSDCSLEMHKMRRFDLEQKLYTCDYCKKTFNQKGSLKCHMRVHDVERTLYSCGICSKRFTTKSNRDIHHRNHTGECPFMCTTCGRAFTSPWTLKNHIKYVHLKDERYPCHICKKSFDRPSSRYVHMQANHKSSKTHKCDLCPARYISVRSLYRHKREEHRQS